MPPDIVINDLTVLRSCVIFLPPVYPLHMYTTEVKKLLV